MQLDFMSKGWECPKCGAVMSPTTSVCVNCKGGLSFDTLTTIKLVGVENKEHNNPELLKGGVDNAK